MTARPPTVKLASSESHPNGVPLKISKRTGVHFRESKGSMVLVATSVNGQSLQFPPVEYLHGDDQAVDIDLGPVGRLYSYTVVHPGKEKAPYALAMVDFEPGVRAFGRLLLNGRVPALDSAVRVVPFTLADGNADYAFEGMPA